MSGGKFKVKLAVEIYDATGQHARSSLPWKETTGDVLEGRLRDGFAAAVPDWPVDVQHAKRTGHLRIELTIPADGPAHAKEKMLHWADRVCAVAKVAFDRRRIKVFEAEPVG